MSQRTNRLGVKLRYQVEFRVRRRKCVFFRLMDSLRIIIIVSIAAKHRLFVQIQFHHIKDINCSRQYDKLLQTCPAEILNSDTCVDKVTEICYNNLKSMEGWYCSCRYNGTVVDPEQVEQCNVYKRVFTHNKCIEQVHVVSNGNIAILTTGC